MSNRLVPALDRYNIFNFKDCEKFVLLSDEWYKEKFTEVRQFIENEGITVRDIKYEPFEVMPNSYDSYCNASYCIGGDAIEIGYYDNENTKLISLLHEYGHTKLNEYGRPIDIFNAEKLCWKIGLELAEKFDIPIIDDDYKFIVKFLILSSFI